ncbi:MAG: peptidase C11 [Oscillospiraceae bacterium]|nr:peptidase C11 [Oscillospiraceae bacterium]
MENNRPKGREKDVTGPGKTVHKRGDGLGTGPVGDAGEYKDQQPSSGGARSGGTRAGGTRASGGAGKLIALVLAVLLGGGGGGLAAFLGSQSGTQTQTPPAGQQQQQQPNQGGSTDWTQLFSGLGGGSVSSGWENPANTGRLDTSVAKNAREKYTKLLGGGKDTATIMVYMCGTDLESRSGMGTADLQEMLNARFGDNLNLLVYTGGCKGWKNNVVSSSTNQVWQVKDGQLVKLRDNLGSVSMTDPSTLSDYIQWCAKDYPASRYELILWDHGGGSVSGYGYDEKFASTGSMNLAEVDSALKAAGVKFDFIGFDACLMATAETALTLTQYADYLIASEETEPGVGWYYTDWLTAFGENTSMPTIELGKQIVDSFVDTCAEKCRGQLTTLSVIDLAELEVTLPDLLASFSKSTNKLIQDKQYQTVSNARSGAREFAQSSQIDQVDLVHLAKNLGTKEGDALAEALLGAVKYNRTSSNMTNAYGISIYFPYRKSSNVDKAASTFNQIGMDKGYIQCIRQFASLEVSGQAASGGTGSPLSSLLGNLGGSGGSADDISSLLGDLLGGSFGRISGLDDSNSDFLSDRALGDKELAQYLAENRFPAETLLWQEGADGVPVIRLSEEQWGLVHSLELNLFYDDGEGYIDLGLDNVFDFDEEGGLLGKAELAKSWLAIDGQPVAYYHTATVDDGTNYTITGRVPVLHNGVRSELILVFDNDQPHGYVAGVRTVYHDGETDTVAKNQAELQPGDTLEFLCDYYSYDGDYQDSYLLGDPITVSEQGLTVSDVPLEGSTRATYRFTDLYGRSCWTAVIPS